MRKLIKSLIAGLMLTTAISASADLTDYYKNTKEMTLDKLEIFARCEILVTKNEIDGRGYNLSVLYAVKNDKNYLLQKWDFNDKWFVRFNVEENEDYIWSNILFKMFGYIPTSSMIIAIDKNDDIAFLIQNSLPDNSDIIKFRQGYGPCTWFK